MGSRERYVIFVMCDSQVLTALPNTQVLNMLKHPLLTKGMRARGHCMFWAVPHHQTPAWVEQLQGQDLVEAVEEHVDNLLEHFEAGVAMVALALICQT